MFKADFKTEDSITNTVWGSVPPDINIRHDFHSGGRLGGPYHAEMTATGNINALWDCFLWLRRPVEIFNPRGQSVWWGYVNEIRLETAGFSVSMSLDSMANKVSVLYSYKNGTEYLTGDTGALDDTGSQARYGIKEYSHTLGDNNSLSATAMRATLLKELRYPSSDYASRGSSKEPTVTILCNGWIDTLSWRIFDRLEGRVEFEGGDNTPGIQQAIGWQHTSAFVGFRGATTTYTRTVTAATNATPIVVTTSVAHAVRGGDIVTISGVVGNTATNGTWEARNVTSTTFEIVDSVTGVAIAGNGAYVSGGTMSRIITHSGASKIVYGKRITAATNATPIVITCTAHGFANGTIVSIADIEGNTAANGTYKVASAAANTFALTDVDFGTNIAGTGDYATGGVVTNNVVDGPFGDLLDSQIVTISGSASNNGVHTLLNSAGSSGKSFEVFSALTTEFAGASATVVLTGNQTAQKFVQPEAFTLWRIGVKVAKVGTPVDSLQILLKSDSGGNPTGSTVATALLSGASLSTSATWTWLYPSTNPTLTAAANYWIVLQRSGASSDTNYYLVSLDQTAYSVCKSWDGAAWQAQPQSQYAPFRVWGWEDNAVQLKRILTDTGQFFERLEIVNSTGILTNQYRDNRLDAMAEFRKLFDQGDSTGKRLYANVTLDRVLQIGIQADYVQDNGVVDAQGRVTEVGGAIRDEGLLPHGNWLSLAGVPVHLSSFINVSPFFVDEARWSASNPDLFELKRQSMRKVVLK